MFFSVGLSLLVGPTWVRAAEGPSPVAESRRNFDVPTGDAVVTLKAVAKQGGVEIMFLASTVRGVKTNAVHGEYTARQALDSMVANTPLVVVQDEKTGALTIQILNDPNAQRAAPKSSDRPAAKSADGVTTLSPFFVADTIDKGYYSEKTLLGTRSAQSTMEIPSNISIINQEMLTDLKATSLQSALNYGSSGVKQNQALHDDFQIRGFRTNGIMRDGIVKPSFTRTAIYDVERVEVLKGPGAMLLGENNFLGGAINIITKQPTEEFHGQADLEVSNKNYLKYGLNLSGPIRAEDDWKLLYRVTIGGWHDDRFKEIQNKAEGFYSATLRYLLGKKTSITFQAYDYLNNGYAYFDDVSDSTYPNGRTVPAPFTSFDWSIARNKDTFFNVHEKFYRAEMLQTFTENSSLRVVYALEDQEDRRRLIRQGGPIVNFMLPRQDLPFQADTIVRTLQVDYLHKVEIGPTRHEFSAGAQSDVNEGFQRLNVFTNLPAIDIRHPDFSNDVLLPGFTTFSSNTYTTTTQNHYYIQDNIKAFSDKLIFVGGVRWIERTRDAINKNTNVETLTRSPRVRVNKWGVVYRVTPAISVYGTQAANVFPATGGNLNPGTPYETTRKDQDGTLKEAGLKFNALNGHLYGSVAYFDMAMTNVVVGGNAPDGSVDALGRPIQINTQQAEQRSKGYEIEIGYRQDFTAFGHADIITTYYNADSIDEKGAKFYNSVPYIYTFLGKVTFTKGALKGLTVGAGIHEQGPITEIVGVTTNYWPTTADAFAAYTFRDKWRLSVNVDNLTNKYYIITGGSLSQGSDPRRTRMGMSYNW
ncbi:MAG: TonB-dependent receptor [Verrucomicrobia bacterium]|nr:TonB-dependent receptor [Verrucomicrobiota bacterium]